MMSITQNKTDRFTEDWRAGCIFGINFDFAGWKSVKIWCKEQIASSEEPSEYRRLEDAVKGTNLMRQNLYLICQVWVWIMSYTWQVAKHSTPSITSGQCWTHIRRMLTFILLYTATSKTSFLHGPELAGWASRCNQHTLQLYFSTLVSFLPCHLSS